MTRGPSVCTVEALAIVQAESAQQQALRIWSPPPTVADDLKLTDIEHPLLMGDC